MFSCSSFFRLLLCLHIFHSARGQYVPFLIFTTMREKTRPAHRHLAAQYCISNSEYFTLERRCYATSHNICEEENTISKYVINWLRKLLPAYIMSFASFFIEFGTTWVLLKRCDSVFKFHSREELHNLNSLPNIVRWLLQ